MSILSSIFGGSGKKAARTAIEASNLASKGIREGRDALQREEDFLSGIRNPALQGLSGYFNAGYLPKSQQEIIDLARSSPLFSAIMGTRDAGERSILRNASATGGLRSGATNTNLSDYNMQLENQALLEAYNQQIGERDMRLQGMVGLGGLQSYLPEIAGMTSDIYGTQAQGMVAAQQAREQAKQNRFGNILGVANLGLNAFSGGLFGGGGNTGNPRSVYGLNDDYLGTIPGRRGI